MAIYHKDFCNCGQPFNENGNCPDCENTFLMDYMVFLLDEKGKIYGAIETNYPETKRGVEGVIVSTHGLPKKWRYMSIEEIRETCDAHIVSDPRG